MSDERCPFCGDDDFDLIGLKNHLQNYCDVFDNLEELNSIFSKTGRCKCHPHDKVYYGCKCDKGDK